MDEEPHEKAKRLLQELITESSPDEAMLEAVEEELRILVKQKIAMEKILERLKKAGFTSNREKLTDWLDAKGIRPKKKRKNGERS